MFINLLIYILSFGLIWLGAGLIVSSVDKFSKRLRLSSFIVSFVILGLLTSTPEFAVGLQSVADHNAEIFVGNLLGGIPVIFLLVIPLLAILGNGIRLKHELNTQKLIACLIVIAAPSFLVLDRQVTSFEAVMMILLYLVLALLIQGRHGIFDRENTNVLSIKAYSYGDILKLLLGIGTVFVTSYLIVEKTLYFADFFNISAFYISLIVISLGTNLPELSLAIRSVITGKKEVAFGDYMGSAAANTLLFGIFTLLYAGEVLTASNFVITFGFIIGALVLFYLFSKSKSSISRKEGLILLACYVLFLVVELSQ